MVKKTDLKIVTEFRKKLAKAIVLKKLILFGSRATGKTHEWSDFDLVVVSPNFKGKVSFERGIDFYKYWGYEHPVDFLCYTPEEYNRLKKGINILREAIKEGIEIK